jgi:hypothetical protein
MHVFGYVIILLYFLGDLLLMLGWRIGLMHEAN